MQSNSFTTDQFIRTWGLVVYNPNSSQALVLSQGSDSSGREQLRFMFEVRAVVVPIPNSMVVRIYNPSPNTVQKVIKEFTRITIAAGYRTGRFATIFDGWITQYKYGGETPVDKFLEIYAQDGDLPINQLTVTGTLMPGANSQQQVVQYLQNKAAPYGLGVGSGVNSVAVSPQSRPTVINGMWYDEMGVVSKSSTINGHQGVIWSIQQGKLVLVPAVGGPVGGETAVINAATGLIGFPTATTDGIELRTLLNPSLHVGQKIQLNNAEINQIAAGMGGGIINGIGQTINPDQSLSFFMPVSDDGMYLAAVVEHHGDTRGQDWYSDIVALTIDPTTQMYSKPNEILPSPGDVGYATGLKNPGS